MRKFKTRISPLLKSNGKPICRPDGEAIYWLDELLGGGLAYPEELGRPLVVLISGPPGAGKSLLVQEICYARGVESVRPSNNSQTKDPAEWKRSVIISNEAGSKAVAANLEGLGLR